MSQLEPAADLTTSPRAFTLWVDGCGGFRLLTGNRWSIGGATGDDACDVAVQTSWPRHAGWLAGHRGEYYWAVEGEQQQWLRPDAILPIAGEAKLRLRRPSPLSESAVLCLETAHRFAKHVDAVVVVQQTVLIGPGADCHVRCRNFEQRWVLVENEGRWRLKIGDQPAQPLELDQRFLADRVGLMLENG